MVDLETYFRESNAIEDVHDPQAIDEALEAWHYLDGLDELSHDVIKHAHELLMRNRQPDLSGEYREVQVYVGDREPPAPARVPYEMDALLERDDPETGLEALEWHVDFELIHPFRDGNGRVGRLLYLWHCRQIGIEPILWRAEDREGYYGLFRGR